MKKGDIVLIPFPFTNLKGIKNRPAIVLFSDKTDVTVCFVTSELKWQGRFDFIVEPDEKNGLKVKSLVRIGKIATIDKDLVFGALGDLSENNILQLNNSLLHLLDLG